MLAYHLKISPGDVVLARVWGLRAGGMAVVLDNVRRVSGTSGQFEPEKQVEHGPEHIERLARLGCETVRHLAMHDQEAARAGRPRGHGIGWC
jgi:uridine phosphorylase